MTGSSSVGSAARGGDLLTVAAWIVSSSIMALGCTEGGVSTQWECKARGHGGVVPDAFLRQELVMRRRGDLDQPVDILLHQGQEARLHDDKTNVRFHSCLYGTLTEGDRASPWPP
jgi:hypothetical protein